MMKKSVGPMRWVSMASGSGSTFEAIVKEAREGSLKKKIEPVGLLVDREGAEAIQRAKKYDVPFFITSSRSVGIQSNRKKSFENVLLELLTKLDPDIITQNGWLSYTPEAVVGKHGAILYNQHPADTVFGGIGMHGLAVHAAVLEFNRLTGRNLPTRPTIHRVTTDVDGGAIVVQREVPAYPDDTPRKLAMRVLPVEHRMMIDFIGDWVGGNVAEISPNPIVRDGEKSRFKQAIRFGRKTYPNG